MIDASSFKNQRRSILFFDFSSPYLAYRLYCISFENQSHFIKIFTESIMIAIWVAMFLIEIENNYINYFKLKYITI